MVTDVRGIARHVYNRWDARARVLNDVDDLAQEAHLILVEDADASAKRIFDRLRYVMRRGLPVEHPRLHEPVYLEAEAKPDYSGLLAGIGRLDATAQLILVLSYWYAWPLVKIGEAFGASHLWVWTRRRRALHELRGAL